MSANGFSRLPCKHCGTTVEGGPMALAKWGWCVNCDGPIHDKRGCNNRCPRAQTFDLHRQDEWVQTLIAKPWRRR